MTRRKLTKEEIDLWKKVVEHTERLNDMRSETTDNMDLPPPTPKPRPSTKMPLHSFTVGGNAAKTPRPHDLKSGLVQRLAQDPLRMDEKAFRRMKRGKLKPEGKLDLHGMRLDNAHSALTKFVLSAQASGKRLVLVITGKGKDRDEPGPMPIPRGILRHQVPQWLALPPLAQAVLQVTPAHLSHGGEGAYYVYLRRIR